MKQTDEEVDQEYAKAEMDRFAYGTGYVKLLADGSVKHVPAETIYFKVSPSEDKNAPA